MVLLNVPPKMSFTLVNLRAEIAFKCDFLTRQLMDFLKRFRRRLSTVILVQPLILAFHIDVQKFNHNFFIIQQLLGIVNKLDIFNR